MKSIYTLTLSPALDKSTFVDHVVPEHKLRCEDAKFEPGGGGINVSRALKKVGGDSVAVYTKGGPTGDLLQKLLNLEFINQLPVECKNWTRENFVVVETSSNQQFRFGMPGATLHDAEWMQCLEILANPSRSIDYIVASGSMPHGVPTDFYARLSIIAKEKKAKLILDSSGDSLKAALKEGIYLLKPNTKELGELVGYELNNVKEQEEAAKQLIKSGTIEILVVSMGPSGAMIVSEEGVHHVSAPSVKKRSTVGAGDCMVAGLVLSLSKGFNTLDALRYGIACGTAATMNTGTGLCVKEDVEELFSWMKKN
ncbi:MAG TPA: 1-phosphofructokinase family hexose kinase [Cytophagaceae bacterium]|jgi:6-phosphofructokinase 2|nr:1-phosphofructokinase family hexose kinase [Cytophagaceae bacterium]